MQASFTNLARMLLDAVLCIQNINVLVFSVNSTGYLLGYFKAILIDQLQEPIQVELIHGR